MRQHYVFEYDKTRESMWRPMVPSSMLYLKFCRHRCCHRSLVKVSLFFSGLRFWQLRLGCNNRPLMLIWLIGCFWIVFVFIFRRYRWNLMMEASCCLFQYPRAFSLSFSFWMGECMLVGHHVHIFSGKVALFTFPSNCLCSPFSGKEGKLKQRIHNTVL